MILIPFGRHGDKSKCATCIPPICICKSGGILLLQVFFVLNTVKEVRVFENCPESWDSSRLILCRFSKK